MDAVASKDGIGCNVPRPQLCLSRQNCQNCDVSRCFQFFFLAHFLAKRWKSPATREHYQQQNNNQGSVTYGNYPVSDCTIGDLTDGRLGGTFADLTNERRHKKWSSHTQRGIILGMRDSSQCCSLALSAAEQFTCIAVEVGKQRKRLAAY